MGRPEAWRLLVDPPARGPWNLAVDEAILDSYAGPAAPSAPTLRLYAWSPPALSLGRAQSVPRLGQLASAGVDLVRRPTGGGAVLHDHERTYSVCGLLRTGPFAGAVVDNYRALATALCEAMRLLGAEATAGTQHVREASVYCFERASIHEIAVGGRKLVGSAQLRRRAAFLQHGSILLDHDAARLSRVLGRDADASRFTNLRTVLGRRPPIEEVDAALIAAFRGQFGVELLPGTLTEAERERARVYARTKYANPSWTSDAVAVSRGASGVF